VNTPFFLMASCNSPVLAPAPIAHPAAPNIALVLADDLDLILGGTTPLTRTRRILAEQGGSGENWFVTTPVCCPSRAQLLTGRYFHNLKNQVASEKSGCMHINVTNHPKDPFYSELYFASHLQSAGYTIGVFGKHLNTANMVCPPPGVDSWFINGGGDYFSPTFTVANAGDATARAETWNNCTYGEAGACYSTSVIGNVSVAWTRRVLAEGTAPLFAYIAVKAPHIQDGPGWPTALAAPWHASSFASVSAPRTPNWNRSCTGHHWLVRTQPPLTAEQAMRSDALYRSRWQAALSIDDLVAELAHTLDGHTAAGGRESYILFTSDHGYRFGQFRMPQGKWNVYDTDLRVPFFVRGPGIAPNSSFGSVGSNVDVMPTILGPLSRAHHATLLPLPAAIQPDLGPY
jgi:N-acetylglucosamine-6-sulfatase